MLRTRLIAGVGAGLVTSAVAATLLTAIHLGDALLEPLRVVPGQPAPLALRVPDTDAVGATWLRPSVAVARGEVITDPAMAERVSEYEAQRRPVDPKRAAALAMLYMLMTGMLTMYLRRYSVAYGGLLRTQAGLLALLVLMTALGKVLMVFTVVPASAIPIAVLPLWVALYLDRRTAFVMGLTASFILATSLDFRADTLISFVPVASAAVLGLHERKRPLHVLAAGAVAAGVNVVCALMLDFVNYGRVDIVGDLALLDRSRLLASALGGLSAGALAVMLSGLVGRMLGMVSRTRLLDLADLQQPLLQRMQKEAPGSWEHSRAMANLAEAASSAVGADALLTRVGAYYHDLGKSIQPKYFIENLEAGETTPHEGLDPDMSADAIMAHVVEGVRILRDGGIPEPVVEFAYTHHGTSVIEFFWHRCLAEGNPRGLTEDFFRYPGMRPRTKETAILMLIDSIEAASRTIDPPERAKFEEMVNRILFVKLKQGQLDESGLSMGDLRVMTSRITDTLVKSRHTRVRYPWQEAKEKGKQSPPIPDASSDAEVNRGVEKAARTRALQSPEPREATGSTRSAGGGTGSGPRRPQQGEPALDKTADAR